MMAEVSPLRPGRTSKTSSSSAMSQASGKRGGMRRIVLIAVLVMGGAAVLGFGWHWIAGMEPAQDRQVSQARPAPINAERAFGYLKQLVALGPRPAGSEANIKQRQLVTDHFRRLGAQITEQPFTARHPLTGKPVQMVNVIGSWFPERADRVVILAHYDTRPHPDNEFDPQRKQLPFLGANDGASGVALLMELAHHLNDSPTQWGVDLLIVDGEELVYDQANGERYGKFFLGAEEFAKQYKKQRRTPGKNTTRYVCGILLDMIGGKDQIIRREPNSVRFANGLVRELWGVARQIGASSFVEQLGREVRDDHLALIDADIPTVDLIDFEYPHWHLASDTVENCSAESLEEIGRVVTAWLSLPRSQKKR
jgi:hypothetical protein